MVVDCLEIGRTKPEELLFGHKAIEWPDDAKATVGPDGVDGPPDDFLQNAFNLDILSARLFEALREAAIEGIQYLPLKVFTSRGELAGTFWIANVVTRLPALNTALSTYTIVPPDYFIEARRGEIAGLRKPVLKGEVLLGLDVLRLEEFFPPVFVSERFRNVVKFGRFNGCEFTPVEVA
jgi:hypothetical protein